MQSKEIKTKIVLLGDTSVGKSSILKRLKFNSFDNNLDSTIGCEFFAKDFKIDSNNVKLLIWDTAGQEVFRSFTPNFLRGAKIILIVYSVAFKKSFLNINTWIDEAKKIPNSTIIIVGSKCDLPNEIDDNELEKLKKKLNENFYLFGNVSSKENINIHELFLYISKICVEKDYGNVKNNTININENKIIQKKNCCFI